MTSILSKSSQKVAKLEFHELSHRWRSPTDGSGVVEPGRGPWRSMIRTFTASTDCFHAGPPSIPRRSSYMMLRYSAPFPLSVSMSHVQRQLCYFLFSEQNKRGLEMTIRSFIFLYHFHGNTFSLVLISLNGESRGAIDFLRGTWVLVCVIPCSCRGFHGEVT